MNAKISWIKADTVEKLCCLYYICIYLCISFAGPFPDYMNSGAYRIET